LRTQKVVAVAALLLVVAACATTQRGKEIQAAAAIEGVNRGTVLALDNGIIQADEGEAVQVVTRTATSALKGAIAARKAGKAYEIWKAAIDAVYVGVKEAQRVLEGRVSP
jgi:hypothetical protein